MLSVFLTVIATFMVISQSGYGSATPLCSAAVYVAFWPSLLLQLDHNKMFVEMIPLSSSIAPVGRF